MLTHPATPPKSHSSGSGGNSICRYHIDCGQGLDKYAPHPLKPNRDVHLGMGTFAVFSLVSSECAPRHGRFRVMRLTAYGKTKLRDGEDTFYANDPTADPQAASA